MPDESPWLPRGQRRRGASASAPDSRGVEVTAWRTRKRLIGYGVTAILVAIPCLVAVASIKGGLSPIASVLVLVGVFVVLFATFFAVIALLVCNRRTWLVGHRPRDAVFLLWSAGESRAAIASLGSGMTMGATLMASVGSDAIRIWASKRPDPLFVIPYRSVRRAWIDIVPHVVPNRQRPRTLLPAAVILELDGPGTTSHRIPLVLAARLVFGSQRSNDLALGQFVEALSVRTALPWLDEPPHTTTAPEAEAAGAVESSE